MIPSKKDRGKGKGSVDLWRGVFEEIDAVMNVFIRFLGLRMIDEE